MSAIGGRLASVNYGANKIAGIGTWELSGFKPDVLESTAFGDTVKSWVEAGIGDGGEVSFSGNYDPADTNGQVALNALANTGAQLTNIYFYESTNVFWRVKSGGYLVMEEFQAIKMAKNALGTISFKAKVSTNVMERVS